MFSGCVCLYVQNVDLSVNPKQTLSEGQYYSVTACASNTLQHAQHDTTETANTRSHIVVWRQCEVKPDGKFTPFVGKLIFLAMSFLI